MIAYSRVISLKKMRYLPAETLISLLPPLVINYDELDEAVNIIEKTLKENR